MDIGTFIKEYQDGNIQITDDISYSTRDVIKNNRRLFHGKFEDEYETDGETRKIFFRTAYILYNLIYINTDIDSKDIHLKSTNGENINLVDLLKQATRTHLRLTKFGKYLNQFGRRLLMDGTNVTKIVDDKLKNVDLLNIIIPPHSNGIQDTGLVERIQMTWDEIQSYKKDFEGNWADVEAQHELLKDNDKTYFTVYEWWTEFEIDGKWHKGCIKYLESEMEEPDEDDNEPTDWNPFLELTRFKTPYKKRRTSKRLRETMGEFEELYPYLECHMVDVPGRWLGFGIFELVEGLQEYYNEVMNLKRKQDRINLLGLLFHQKGAKSSSITQDMLDQLETGGVVEGDKDENLSRIPNNPVTGDAMVTIEKIFELSRQIVGATSQAVGEVMPSSMPATNAIINQQLAKSTYDDIIEQKALFLTELFADFYMPVIVKEMTEEDTLEMVGDPEEMKEFDAIYVEKWLERTKKKFQEKGGVLMPEDVEKERERLSTELQKGKDTRWPEITDEIVRTLNYRVEFYVTNESFDKGILVKNIMEILRDPLFPGSRKKLYNTLLDLFDLGGSQFDKDDEERAEEMAQQMAMQGMVGGGAPRQQKQQPRSTNPQSFIRANEINPMTK